MHAAQLSLADGMHRRLLAAQTGDVSRMRAADRAIRLARGRMAEAVEGYRRTITLEEDRAALAGIAAREQECLAA